MHGALRFRANLTLRSVYVRDALRLGAGLALASAAVDAFGLQHGFWVAFATLTVIKSGPTAALWSDRWSRAADRLHWRDAPKISEGDARCRQQEKAIAPVTHAR